MQRANSYRTPTPKLPGSLEEAAYLHRRRVNVMLLSIRTQTIRFSLPRQLQFGPVVDFFPDHFAPSHFGGVSDSYDSPALAV
jgi:hypothetical protein